MTSTKKFIILILIIFCIIPQVSYAKKYKLKIATIAPADTPWHSAILTAKKNIEKRTNKNVRLLLFMGGQLGAEIQTLEGTQLGTLQIWAGSTGAIENLRSEFGVFDLPFLWESPEELYYVLDNVVKESLFKKLESIGLKTIAWTENGWRHFANKKSPIHTPDDLQPIKWRSQESEVHLAMWKAFETTATPVNMTEVFSALQTGMVDGADNSLLILSATGWWETMKYLTISNHIYQPGVIVCNLDYWNKLPKEYQQIISEEFTNSANFLRAELAKFEPEMIEVFKTMGYEVNTLTPEERKLFEEKTKVIHGQFTEKFSDILPLIQQGKEEFKKK